MSPVAVPSIEAEKSPTAQPRVIVVMPAWNAARTLAETVAAIPPGFVYELILVDDKSTDNTVELARSLPGVRLIWHPHNVGYGGNQKTCYLEVLQRGGTS
jgi:glycosyltransferase involved in cell wall biosynthesis